MSSTRTRPARATCSPNAANLGPIPAARPGEQFLECAANHEHRRRQALHRQGQLVRRLRGEHADLGRRCADRGRQGRGRRRPELPARRLAAAARVDAGAARGQDAYDRRRPRQGRLPIIEDYDRDAALHARPAAHRRRGDEPLRDHEADDGSRRSSIKTATASRTRTASTTRRSRTRTSSTRSRSPTARPSGNVTIDVQLCRRARSTRASSSTWPPATARRTGAGPRGDAAGAN